MEVVSYAVSVSSVPSENGEDYKKEKALGEASSGKYWCASSKGPVCSLRCLVIAALVVFKVTDTSFIFFVGIGLLNVLLIFFLVDFPFNACTSSVTEMLVFKILDERRCFDE